MSTSFLNKSIQIFASFGNIKSRSMFGGFGLFSNNSMFALVINDALYLRATLENETEFQALGMQPYCYLKRGFPVHTKYYQVLDAWWEDSNLLLTQAKKSLEISIADNKAKQATTPKRIKDLPNLRLSTERLLKKAGIDSVEKLRSQGALGAFRALQETHGKLVTVDLLWSLEGALTNTHSTVISPQRRNELLSALA